MTDPDFNRLFERFNASQMQADRDAGRIYSWSMIAALAFAAVCVAAVLTMGVR